MVSQTLKKASEQKLSHRFEDALMFAAQLHATQIRKGSCVPYIAHLIGVASIALELIGAQKVFSGITVGKYLHNLFCDL